MLNIKINPEKIFAFSKSSMLPALLTGFFFIYFYAVSEYSEDTYHSLHAFFIAGIVLTLIISAYFHVFEPLMGVSVIYISYILINGLRYVYGEDYIFSAGYNIWTIFLFSDLLLVAFLGYRPWVKKNWSFYYVFLLSQTYIIEKLLHYDQNTDSYYFYKHVGMLNYPALYIAVFCMFMLLVRYINKGRILSGAALFSSISVFMGVFFSDNLFAFGLFFLAAVLTELVSLISYLFYIRFKDEDLNISNYNAFLYDAEKKYPLKYSIAIMYLDDYARLLKRFGHRKMIMLKKMFFARIKKSYPNVLIYNYKEDALILSFINTNAGECYEQAEDIRRSLVKSIFVFNESSRLQLTVSQCVSEKKRSDADAEAVLLRAEENLRKACKFTRNITIKA